MIPSRLATLQIQEPCSLRWEELQGDQRKRFCKSCSRHVHNVSAMRAEEVERLVAAQPPGERLCLTWRIGPDGRPVTLPDAAPEAPADPARGRMHRLAAGLSRGVAALAGLLAACSRAAEPPQAPATPPEDAPVEALPDDLRALGGMVCAPDDVVMGEVALPEPVVLGKVATGD